MTPWKDTGLTPKGSRRSLGYGSPKENINRKKTTDASPISAWGAIPPSDTKPKNKEMENPKTTAQLLQDFASARGLDISQVFDHFLQYIVWAHTLPEYGKPIGGWPYKPTNQKFN